MENLRQIIPMAHWLVSMLPHKDSKALFANLLEDYVVKTETSFEVEIENEVILCSGLVFKNFGDNYLSLSPHPLNGDDPTKWESILLLPSLKFATEVTTGKFSRVLKVSWESKKHEYARVWKFMNENDLSSTMEFILEMRDEIYNKEVIEVLND